MDAFEFVLKYSFYLDEIQSVVKPELLPVIEELQNVDPHDLVTPESWFPNESAVRGYIWSLFLKRVGNQLNNKISEI